MSSMTPPDPHPPERLAVSQDGECLVVRVDVRAATLRYADGVLELRLPKALLPLFLHEV
jgi:hypothetical protein